MAEKKIKAVNPYRDMVEITLPRATAKEQNFEFVAVNGHTYQVPRNGRPVAVPRPVYEVLMNRERMRDVAEAKKEDARIKQN